MTEAFPLEWPLGWPRTKSPRLSRFGDHTLHKVISNLHAELRRLGGRNIVISTNIPLRRDGLPYSNFRVPDDKGVAVYFVLKGENQCFPCDRWNKVEHNLWAIVKTIEALRGLERWGSQDMVNAAFRGFKALPEAGTQPRVVYFPEITDIESLDARKRDLVKKLHPDKGGDSLEFGAMMDEYNRRKEMLVKQSK